MVTTMYSFLFYHITLIIPRLLYDKHMKQPKVVTKISKTKDSAFARFPLAFTLLGTFGLVATLYGFEGIIDSTPLGDEPLSILCIGLLILLVTGTLYKKLD